MMAITRMAIALVFLSDARELWRAGGIKKIFALISVVIAFALGVGIWTKAFALIAVVDVLYLMLREPNSIFKNKISALLAVVILVVIFVNGPGPFAVDLPY